MLDSWLHKKMADTDCINDTHHGNCKYFWALLPISEFVLDKKFQQNASKFAIFYIYKNPKLLFPLINAPVYVDIDLGIHLGKM